MFDLFKKNIKKYFYFKINQTIIIFIYFSFIFFPNFCFKFYKNEKKVSMI